MDRLKNRNFKIVKVPPENGYAYILLIGYTLTTAVCMAHSNSFGLMFNGFLLGINSSTSVITNANALAGIMICISGALVKQGKRWFSLRQMSIFGCSCFSLCWFLCAFIKSGYQMYLTLGLLNGVGCGIIMVTGVTVFNSYFIKKRVMMMGICMSVVGTAPIVFPFLVEYLLNFYGYRGMMVLVGALTAHTIVGSALFQPIEWHLEKKAVYYDQPNNDKKEKLSDAQTDTNELAEREQCTSLLTSKRDTLNSKIMTKTYKMIIDEQLSSTTNHNDTCLRKKSRGLWEILSEELEVSLLKSTPVLNVAFAVGLGMVGDVNFNILQPLLLFEYGFTQSQVTKCISITSMADFSARITLAIVGRFFDVKSRHLCYIGMCCITIGKFVFLQFNDFHGVIIITAIIGFFRGWFFVTLPLLFAEIVPIDKVGVANAWGLLMNGFLNATLAPMFGFVRDVTGSYLGSLYIISSLYTIVIILWTYEFFFMKKK